jgi:hypothetical protein
MMQPKTGGAGRRPGGGDLARPVRRSRSGQGVTTFNPADTLATLRRIADTIEFR